MRLLVLLVSLFLTLIAETSAQGVVRNRVGINGQNDFWVEQVFNVKLTTTTEADTIDYSSGTLRMLGTIFESGNDTAHYTPFGFENNTGDTLRVKIVFASVSQNGYPYSSAAVGLVGAQTPAVTTSFISVPPQTSIVGTIRHMTRTFYEKITVSVITDANTALNDGYWRLYKIHL